MPLPTVDLELGEFDAAYEGHTAVVRERVSARARQFIDNARQPRVVRDASGQVREAGSDFWSFTKTLLEHSLVSWSGVTDTDGNPIPATPRGLEHEELDDALVDWLVVQVERIQANARRRTPAERKVEASASSEP